MDNQTLHIEMLDLIVAPCFCVKNGVIQERNQAARNLPLGEKIAPLLKTGQEEYAAYTGGCLYLTLNIGGTVFGAAVQRVEDADLFLLEGPEENQELRALALAAKDLRGPLSGILSTAQQLSENCTEAASLQLSALNRGLAQLLRIVGNMSAASAGGFHPELLEITGLCQEIFEKAGNLLEEIGLEVRYQGPEHRLYCLADPQELDRAVLNLLSNGAKFTPKGGTITASLTRQGRMLRLCVQDTGSGIPDDIRGSVFRRYLRQPAIEDGRFGLGLGLVLVRACASHHGGTVLIDHPPQGGTRVTMTIAIRQDNTGTLRSPVLRVDYAGERDHGLIELSEVLPADCYKEL